MTLQHMEELFGELQNFYFYRVNKNKSDLEILQDVNHIIFTGSSPQGLFVKSEITISHQDYTRIEN